MSSLRPHPGLVHEGELHLILGPMYSGKTSKLISEAQKHLIAEQTCIIINHSLDTRYDTGHIVSHNAAKLEATHCSRLSEVPDIADGACIFIDEAQFFEKEDLWNFCMRYSKHCIVYVAGLDAFHDMSICSTVFLVPLANSVCKLNAVCRETGRAAIFTAKIAGGSSQIEVGDTAIYQSVCRDVYRRMYKRQ